MEASCPHLSGVPREADGQRGGEGLQVPGLGQLRHEALRVDVHPLLTDPRAEVKVEAALKDLIDELGVHGHVSEGVKGLGHELGSVLGVQELPGRLLLLSLEGTERKRENEGRKKEKTNRVLCRS